MDIERGLGFRSILRGVTHVRHENILIMGMFLVMRIVH